MRKVPLKTLVQVAILVAMEVVLSRFLSISTPYVKIGFGFLPLAITGMLYGPAWGAAAGALADFIGAMLFPIGPYFAGFTLTAGLIGAVFGFCLHRQGGVARVLAAVTIVNLPLSLGLNTLWIHILYGKAFLALLPGRALQSAVMLVVQLVLLWPLSGRVRTLLKSRA